jgi:hypothetical protein
MTETNPNNHRRVLDETATSIKKLVLDLENSEMDGQPITASEIKAIASQLQIHVEDLLAASRNLRNERPET